MDIQTIRLLWNKRAMKTYNDNVGKARRNGGRPTWIQSDPWDSWKEAWNTPEFKANSEKQKANRAANPHLHTSGSRSHLKVRKDLAEELQREPTPLELHIKTHKRKANGEFVDRRSREIAERSQEIIAQKSSQSGTPPSYQDECDAYLDAAGGVRPGGAVAGLGSAAAEYYRDQIGAPRRVAPRLSELQRENVTLRAEVITLREAQTTQASQIERLQHLMEQIQANQLSSSTLPTNDIAQ